MKKIMDNEVADTVLVSGLVGTIFLSADGANIGEENKKILKGKGLESLVPEAGELLKKYRERIEMPVDLAFQKNGSRDEFSVKNPEDHQIMDIGAESISRYKEIIEGAKLVVANGPCGVFEKKEFSLGTEEMIKSIAESKGFSVISGGHLSAMAQKLDIANKISYISTGGKATMSFLAGEKLPGVEALKV
jgi:phosphoglycerate kinase